MSRTLVLTDAPEGAGKLVPAGEWTRRCQEDLTHDDWMLWEALGRGGDPWTLDLASTTPESSWGPVTDFWSRLVLISDASQSQFDALANLFRTADALPGPVATVALTGRNFRGLRGRRWETGEGNLYLSVALTPRLPAVQLGLAFSMLSTVAVVDAVRGVTDGAARVGIKWVNDILDRGRKIGGVLATTHTRGETVESAVLGVGLNIATCPEVEPTVFVPETGCLNEMPGAEDVTLQALLPAVLTAFARRYRDVLAGGPDSLLEEYRRNSLITDREVRIWAEDIASGPENSWGAPLATGVVRAIREDLSLIIEGRAEPVTRGRLAFEDVCRNRGL